jgi:hypothetical protein
MTPPVAIPLTSSSSTPLTTPPSKPQSTPAKDERFDRVAEALRAADPGLARHTPISIREAGPALVDYLYAGADDPHSPAEIFPRLRWGGQFVFYSDDRSEVLNTMHALAACGFEIPRGLEYAKKKRWWLPVFGRKTWCVAARKLELVMPGEYTERFTYNVHLVPYASRNGAHGGVHVGEHGGRQTGGHGGHGGGHAGGHGGLPSGGHGGGQNGRKNSGLKLVGVDHSEDHYIVAKEVPTDEMVRSRLRHRWPDLPAEVVEKRVRKFVDKIFPIFLTREAAILMIIQRDLPEEYRSRMPRVIDTVRDDRGYVRKLTMNWLRNGGKPLSQMEFARQSSDLLRVLHDRVGVMHLDLRLDNFVITENGVGFVDFGSSVRDDEDLKENPLLNGLFSELMRTSEIQRMLVSMSQSGKVTSNAITCGVQKVDKAVDCFYLAMQISQPHVNPDLRGLITYHPESNEAKELARLTEAILRPHDPTRPAYKSAADILRGIERIQRFLAARPGAGAA